jgi:betaine-aldehyde dehydrogenase
MRTRDTFFIGGEWTAPAGDGWLDVASPTTEEVFGRVPESTPADIDAAVAAAREAFENGPWPRMTVAERGEYLLRMVEVLRPRVEELTRLQIDEMGGPYVFMQPITGGILNAVAYEIGVASGIDRVEVRDGAAGKVIVRRDPVGVSAGIIPWNGPMPVLIGRMLPALLSGCTLVMKPAPETPLSGYVVAEALAEAGLPKGVFNLVPGGREVGEHLVKHPGVDRVSFTGSSVTGSQVASLCGAQLKPATLELGGKSAAIVLPDADLDQTLPLLISGSFDNTGQVCHATTRILVSREQADELVERLAADVAGMKVGDPHDADTYFGPLVAERQRDRVEGYIASGLREGARAVIGGGRPADQPKGWFVEPTIFVDVESSMQIAREEIFGPVVCVMPYMTEDEAVAIANDSEYGLGGAIYTSDVEHGLELAARVKTGMCRINDGPPAGGGGPFGGVKRSGLGRERSREGYQNYFELKSVTLPAGYVPSGSAAAEPDNATA